MAPPHWPVATKVNDACTVPPPALITANGCAAVGVLTPFPDSKRTVTLVASAEPEFVSENRTVTGSPASMTLFVGKNPSDTRVVEFNLMTGYFRFVGGESTRTSTPRFSRFK